MATTEQIALLRRKLANPATLDDETLGDLLDTADGSEPHARLAAYLILQAGAAEAVKFSEGNGAYAEEAQMRFEHYTTLVTQTMAEVAILDQQAAALARGNARTPTRVAVQVWF